jgi:hypothetical protein
LLDRPSRIRYVKEFGNVSKKAVSEIIEDKLINKEHKSHLLAEIEKLRFSTIDIIENMIFEYNIHGNIIGEDIFNIPQKSYTFITLRIDLKTYVNRKIPVVKSLEDIIEFSKKLGDSGKNYLSSRGARVELKKILPSEVKDVDESFDDYVRNLFLGKAGLDNDLFMYENCIDIFSVTSWSSTLFENLVLENGDEIVELRSDCFKAMRDDDPDDIYYGIILG